MGSTFFGLVDMGLLGSPMGPLGSPSLVSYFILFINNCDVHDVGYFGMIIMMFKMIFLEIID